MIFGQDRAELRQMYRDAWEKSRAQAALSPLEAQIAQVVSEHPEYHQVVESERVDDNFSPEQGRENPFLHMGLHLAIRDQVSTGMPPGIREIHTRMAARYGTHHAAEHKMMEALAETLWESQRRNEAPDDRAYLERLRQLL